jgi:hypothetical protein
LTGTTARLDIDPARWSARAWGATANGAAGTVSVDAICIPRGSGGSSRTSAPEGSVLTIGPLSYVATEGRTGGGGDGSLLAACGDGSRLLGGGAAGLAARGFLSSSAPADLGDDDQLADDGWRVYFHRSEAGSSPIVVQAVCVRDATARRMGLRYVIGPGTLVPASSRRDAIVRCPPGARVTGGGPYASGPVAESGLVASRPVDLGDADRIADDGWIGTTVNEGGATKTLAAAAICASGRDRGGLASAGADGDVAEPLGAVARAVARLARVAVEDDPQRVGAGGDLGVGAVP